MALTQNSFSILNLLTNIFQNNFYYVQHWFITSEGFKKACSFSHNNTTVKL